MSKPEDISQDLWNTAAQAHGYPTTHDRQPAWVETMITITALAIQTERERCAVNIERRNGKIPERQEIANELRNGVVIGSDGQREGR